jgi:hypothetical protein
MRVLILGAGFGGLELATRLSEALGDEVEVTLFDQSDAFTFGYAKLEVMFGQSPPEAVRLPYRDFAKPGVSFRQEKVVAIEPERKRVVTERGAYEGDVLVVALGADLDPAATPGLVERGHEFYSVAGAARVRDVLPNFAGGNSRCRRHDSAPQVPAGACEAALLLHDYLVGRRPRDATRVLLVTPWETPLPVSAEVSAAVLAAFADRRPSPTSIRRAGRSTSPTAARLTATSSWPFPVTSPRRSSRTQGCAKMAGSPSTTQRWRPAYLEFGGGAVCGRGVVRAGRRRLPRWSKAHGASVAPSVAMWADKQRFGSDRRARFGA